MNKNTKIQNVLPKSVTKCFSFQQTNLPIKTVKNISLFCARPDRCFCLVLPSRSFRNLISELAWSTAISFSSHNFLRHV